MSEAIIAEVAGSAVGPAIKGCRTIFSCLKRKYGFVKNINENFKNLEREEKYLSDKEKNVEDGLKKIEDVATWLKDVKKMKDDITKLKSEYEDVKRSRCLCALCPIHRLLKVGKQIVKMTKKVASLKNEIDQIMNMLEKPPARFIRVHPRSMDQFPSLNEHVQVLQECLKDPNLKRICLWGPQGVGKTTIMEHLHDAVGKSQEFDIIFWAPANMNGNTGDIQELLVKRLNLNVIGLSNHQIADMISEKLTDQSYVLFLDGVSSEINLKEIGIHDEHERGKVVFACRYRNICGQTDEDINVLRLSDEDAQKLFWETVGEQLKNDPDIKAVGDLIISVCGGMPYIIQLIGKTLKNTSNPDIWWTRLDDLKKPTMQPMGELEDFYKPFKLVYDELPSDMQLYLLYWAIFLAGYELHQDYIIECWRAEQFFREKKKLREARRRGQDILDKFVKKSLLQKRTKEAYYKMFEHFQRAAIRIANCNESSCRILVKEKGEEIEEEEWENAHRLSLVGLSLSTVPERPKCCTILTLLLQESNLEEFPRSFFGNMCGLQLLDLHGTGIKLLPTSISSLMNLRALFLNNCSQLILLPSEIGDLHELEILDIRDTRIHCLPTEIGNLINLKCLRVSFVENAGNHNHVDAGPGEMISSNIIARLHSLEELIIDIPDLTNRRWKQNVESIAGEAAALKELQTLYFYFPEVKCFQTFVKNSKSWYRNNTPWGGNSFRSFNILVGYQQRSSPPTEFDVSGSSAVKHLRFSAGVGIPSEVSTIMEQAHSFELIGHQDAARLSDFGADKLHRLRACVIVDCREMTSIIDRPLTDHPLPGDVAFQNLNKLHIENLPKLVNIWEGDLASESLTNLETLTVKKCRSVKKLFSKEMVQKLNKLQTLQVEECEEIEALIEDGSVVDPRAFSQLETLVLIHLPKLSTICRNVSLEWPTLKTIKIEECERLEEFPSIFKKTDKLRVISCDQTWLQNLDWKNDADTRDRFLKLHRSI